MPQENIFAPCRRARLLSRHLKAPTSSSFRSIEQRGCIGEMENRQVDSEVEAGKAAAHPVFHFKFKREPIKIVFPDPSAADERYGGSNTLSILEGELLHPNSLSEVVFIFMHPSGIQNLLPMPVAMARAGLHVITCTSRFPNNDSCLVMEKVVIDLGACVKYAKKKLGYKKVVLCGWSGGGSLSSFYQAQAENPTVTHTPAGDKVSLKEAKLVPADALMIMAAHTSRAKIMTEWLDPSVLDERNPSIRDKELDIFDTNNPNKPPYSADFIARYRQAQVDRNRRITAWAKAKLATIEATADQAPNDWRMSQRDFGFNVHCTQADLRRLDVTLDPNGREATPLKELAAENHSPVGLARFTTLRSWLSQWSYDESNADGPASLRSVKAPVLVLANGADHLVPLSHPRAMYDAISHKNKYFMVVKDASHYYFDQIPLMASAISEFTTWLRKTGILEQSLQKVP
mmetsp:Transcript_19255/g.34261  ORF Transcript_19255/g.34261 Transcript_19255/m.34261 type:complete len:459 (+) Transcript_19255:165-1541(+)|eukprot:CAMPEP_0184544072 /NCGR_PEP_ID=MMETSP0199_2-20130426/3376_1 /TAXON_ID=1112570 /ORGANISM="Thraustochytrium sp., Strain LLF1b" /LENGTH=458 /DNA_ID=CAMNT_0026938199 /DNA_START=156 /DNA_END=1532 /DNA_ORIENTATION=+